MLENYLDILLIAPSLKASSKEEVLREFAVLINKERPELTADIIESALSEREHIDSTGIEKGVAIPHAKVNGIEKMIIAVGISHVGIDFHSHDNNPATLFFILLAPKSAFGEHIKVLARLSKMVSSEDLRKKLMASSTKEEIYGLLTEADRKLC